MSSLSRSSYKTHGLKKGVRRGLINNLRQFRKPTLSTNAIISNEIDLAENGAMKDAENCDEQESAQASFDVDLSLKTNENTETERQVILLSDESDESDDDKEELISDPNRWIILDDVECEHDDDDDAFGNPVYSDLCLECSPEITEFKIVYKYQNNFHSNIRGYGTSKRTQQRNQRKHMKLSESACSSQKITDFFNSNNDSTGEKAFVL